MKRISAFTLIELLVVIVIIGILATLTTATFSEHQSRAKDTTKIAKVKQLTQLIQSYAATNEGVFPPKKSGEASCIGLNNGEPCWGGMLTGDTILMDNIGSLLEGITASDQFNEDNNQWGNNLAYHTGSIRQSCNGTSPLHFGSFILWRPEILDQGGSNDDSICQGLGYATCCSSSGLCGSQGGYFCAYKIN